MEARLLSFLACLLLLFCTVYTRSVEQSLNGVADVVETDEGLRKELEKAIAGEKKSDPETSFGEERKNDPEIPEKETKSDSELAEEENNTEKVKEVEAKSDTETTEEVEAKSDTETTEEADDSRKDIFKQIEEINEKEEGAEEKFQSDMMVNAKQAYAMIMGKKGIQGDLVNNKNLYWDTKIPDRTNKWSKVVIVPYFFRSSQEINSRYRSAVAAAIAEYNTKTCIRFVPRTNQRNSIRFIKAGGCYSFVGKQPQRFQDVSLGSGCEHKGIAIHELMHALGYFHEQSRSDRDQFVRIVLANVEPGLEYNFKKQDTIDQGTTYDYNSVMHYGSTAFSRNGRPTIVRLRGRGGLGQREGLSTIDALSLNKIYCNGEGPKPTTNPVTTPPTVVTPGPGNCNLPSESNFCRGVQAGGLCIYCSHYSKCARTCRDRNTSCRRWATQFCTDTRYIEYMGKNCGQSCFNARKCK